MAVYNHRISTEEVDTQLTVPVNGTAGLQVVFGTAAVNLAEDPMAVTNVPVIAYTFAEAVKQLGYSADYEKYTLCQAMDASFRVFAVAPVIFVILPISFTCMSHQHFLEKLYCLLLVSLLRSCRKDVLHKGLKICQHFASQNIDIWHTITCY